MVPPTFSSPQPGHGRGVGTPGERSRGQEARGGRSASSRHAPQGRHSQVGLGWPCYPVSGVANRLAHGCALCFMPPSLWMQCLGRHRVEVLLCEGFNTWASCAACEGFGSSWVYYCAKGRQNVSKAHLSWWPASSFTVTFCIAVLPSAAHRLSESAGCPWACLCNLSWLDMSWTPAYKLAAFEMSPPPICRPHGQSMCCLPLQGQQRPPRGQAAGQAGGQAGRGQHGGSQAPTGRHDGNPQVSVSTP